MRCLGVALAVLSVGWVGAGCRSPSAGGLDGAHAAAIRDSVRSFLDAFSEAIGEGRTGDVARLYADDPRFLWAEDGRVTYRSAEGIRGALESVGSQFSDMETVFQDPIITPLAPGLAHLATRVRQSFARPDGQGFEFSALITATVIHADSGWRFLTGHTSTERREGRQGEGGS